MEIKPIRTVEDYHAALKEAESLMHVESDSPEGDRLDILATLIEAYEARHFPRELPTPADAIEFSLDQKGLTHKDLEPILGDAVCVQQIMSGMRPLTLPMIRRLHSALGIPAELLIGPSGQEKDTSATAA